MSRSSLAIALLACACIAPPPPPTARPKSAPARLGSASAQATVPPPTTNSKTAAAPTSSATTSPSPQVRSSKLSKKERIAALKERIAMLERQRKPLPGSSQASFDLAAKILRAHDELQKLQGRPTETTNCPRNDLLCYD